MRIKKFTSGLVSAQYSGMAAKKRLAWVRGAIGATFSNVIFDSVAMFKRPLAQRHPVFGPDGERLYANRFALDYMGLSLEEWQQTPGRSFRSSLFVHPDDQERVARDFDANSSRRSASELELRVRKGDGTYRWLLVRFSPLRDEQGQITRWYVASTDIEDRKQAENRLRSENVALREEIDKASMFEEIVGTSPVLKAVLSRISKVAPSSSTVLITGETGTGKELVARAIHRRSDRASRAF